MFGSSLEEKEGEVSEAEYSYLAGLLRKEREAMREEEVAQEEALILAERIVLLRKESRRQRRLVRFLRGTHGETTMVEAVGSFKFARLWVGFRLSCRSPKSLERVSPSSLGRYLKVLFFRNLCPPQPPIAVCQTRSQAYPYMSKYSSAERRSPSWVTKTLIAQPSP